MRAAFIQQTGAPSVIQVGEIPTPVPGQGEVLVKVGASAVNPIDTYIRGGIIAMATQFPYIPGCDMAGTVTALGPDASRFKVGDRVWCSNQSLFGRRGTLAEFAAMDEKWLYPTPASQSDELAAAGALVGITAHLGLHLNAGLKADEVVFVNGGTGGVGSAVVQLAKAAGAKVIATVGSAAKQAICRNLGADLAIDYHSEDMDAQIQAFTKQHGGIHVWFETQREPTFDRTVGLMASRGRIILMAGRAARPQFPVGPFYVKDLRLCGFAMFNASPAEQRECATDLNSLFEQGKWMPQVGKTFPLSEAATAHAFQEQNTLEKQGTLSGKILVLP
ncbi:MAG: Bifunctional protein: zinc-containing alcohol dehydrogenase, Similar to arginate lyase [Planctomycetaceae bacterium]|nr:Bifunctional protein: zinc-containing alcohol dehydrogenase, Similar to arginate lyase [Planctomycetaceae bacterium]